MPTFNRHFMRSDIPLNSYIGRGPISLFKDLVDSWLDSHPEATTSVQDGSITEEKLHPSVVGDIIDDMTEYLPYVTPEQYGAVGDGVANDTAAVQSAINSGKSVMLFRDSTYLVTQLQISGKSNLVIYGNQATIVYNASSGTSARTIIGIINGSHDITIKDLRIKTKWSGDDMEGLFKANIYGISVNQCERVRVEGCDISLVTDALSTNGASDIVFDGNRLHRCGQEPIVTRESSNVVITNNTLYEHFGDGIIVKHSADSGLCDTVISNNTIHSPYIGTLNSFTTGGGGITVNAENTIAGYTVRGLVISGNTIDGTRYGIQLANVEGCVISDNSVNVGTIEGAFVGGSCAIGLTLDTEWSPAMPNTMMHVLFSNNSCAGGETIMKSAHSPSIDVPVEDIVFEGNVCRMGVIASNHCVYAQNSTIIDNVLEGGRNIGQFFDCVVRGNKFGKSIVAPVSPQTSDCYFRGDTCIVENNRFDGYQVYFNCGVLAQISDNAFNLTNTSQGIKLNCPEGGKIFMDGNTFDNGQIGDSNVYYGGDVASIYTDYYRKYAVMSGDTEIGAIYLNRDTLKVYLDCAYIVGQEIVTTPIPFRPSINRQMVGLAGTSGDYSITRVAFATNGTIIVRDSAERQASNVIVDCTIPREL